MPGAPKRLFLLQLRSEPFTAHNQTGTPGWFVMATSTGGCLRPSARLADGVALRCPLGASWRIFSVVLVILRVNSAATDGAGLRLCPQIGQGVTDVSVALKWKFTQRISIFLNVFDVHRERLCRLRARIRDVRAINGEFWNAICKFGGGGERA